MEDVALGGNYLFVFIDHLQLASQQWVACGARLHVVDLPMGHGGININGHNHRRRAKLWLRLTLAASAGKHKQAEKREKCGEKTKTLIFPC